MTSTASKTGTLSLTVGATGVVFGDIGTSPLYAFKESVHYSGTALNDVLGVASLIFWTLMVVVTIKYLSVVMRADNDGEGGILSLLALLPHKVRDTKAGRDRVLFLLILVGTALLFGDGVLTPAISVLSATEGLGLVNPTLGSYAVEIAIAILITLFAVQYRGTHTIGQLFGPVMVVWFLVLGGLGTYRLLEEPTVIRALSPTYALEYISGHGLQSFALAATIILCVTGAEALYADMGHFGARPIRLSWGLLVGPSLVLCYLGQAALVATRPETKDSPFFSLAPESATLALVILATAATVVASQALITGVFSLARQGIQLGLLPRMNIKHTHQEHRGQIYVPFVNFAVGALCIAVVLAFRSSSSLAHAYVLAIAGTMSITTVAFHAVARRVWNWSPLKVWPLTIIFLTVDLFFLAGTISNVFRGGWVPVFFGAVVMVVMVAWGRGYRALANYMGRTARTWDQIEEELEHGSITRVPGIGIYLASPAENVPAALTSQIKVLHAMPADVYVVTVKTDDVPYSKQAPQVDELMSRVTRVTIIAGYMETADIPTTLQRTVLGHTEDVATYYMSERRFVASDKGELPRWMEQLFSLLHRNSQTPATYFGLPIDRVISIGTRVDL